MPQGLCPQPKACYVPGASYPPAHLPGGMLVIAIGSRPLRGAECSYNTTWQMMVLTLKGSIKENKTNIAW